MVIDVFMKLIEGLVKVVEHRRNDRRQLFDDVVQPMYQQLLPVIDEYYALFHQCRSDIAAAKTKQTLSEAIDGIRERRETTLLARETIRTLIEEMEKHVTDKHVIHFAEQVSKFFYSTEVAHVRKVSAMHRFVELCDYVQRNDLDKSLLMEYLSETLKTMSERSSAIASTYSAVRLHCLCPPRFLAKDEESSESG